MVMTDEAKLQKKIKRILKPHLSVAGGYGKCELCGAETSWQINNHFVCPVCSIKHNFVSKGHDYGPCEVCGRQGEWVCGSEDQHPLCHRHRDDWLRWDTNRKYLLKGYEKLPEAEKKLVWEKCFNTFIQEAKQRSEGEEK